MNYISLLFIAALIFVSLPALALDSCKVPAGATYQIDEHNQCRRVTNSTGSAIMVPTKTADEWKTSGGSSFLSNVPNNMSVSTCQCIPRTQVSAVQAGNAGAGDNFGNGVALDTDGNTAIIGARFEDSGATNAGSAYIFVRSGNSWTQQKRIQASNRGADDAFGAAVALSGNGNIAVIGVSNEDSGGEGAGSVYIFKRSGTNWTQSQRIQAADRTEGDSFGFSVDISKDGNYIVVGALTEGSGLFGHGSAYIFKNNSGTYNQQAKIRASDRQDFDWFGGAVSINSNGTTLIVGAQSEDPGGTDAAGSAYIFTRSGSTWSQQKKLVASNKGATDFFGSATAISDDGNTVLIGAPLEDSGGEDAGSVYLFTRSGTTWTQRQRFQASNRGASDAFGTTVELSGDGMKAVVGAPFEDSTASNAGSAYIFTRSGNTFTQRRRIQASNAGSGDQFTTRLGISKDGQVIAAGAQYEDGTASNAGKAYFFICPGLSCVAD